MLQEITDLEKVITEKKKAFVALQNGRLFSQLLYDEQLEFMKLKKMLGEAYFAYSQYVFSIEGYSEQALVAFLDALQLELNKAQIYLNTELSKLDHQTIELIEIDESHTSEQLSIQALAAFLGCGREQNVKEGFRLLDHAAITGSIWAQTCLGRIHKMYQDETNENQAVEWLGLAATQDPGIAMAHLAELHHSENSKYKDHTSYFKLSRISADQGCSHGLFLLAKAYYKGSGVTLSLEKSVLFTRLATEAGHPGALGQMAHFYRNGFGVPQNDQKAFKWNQLAIKQGDESAKHNLALMYLDSKCYLYDKKRGWYLLRELAEGGLAVARNILTSFNDGSIYKKYHALMYGRAIDGAANLVILHPQLLEQVICCDSLLNKDYKSDSLSDISLMLTALTNLKQFHLANDYALKQF